MPACAAPQQSKSEPERSEGPSARPVPRFSPRTNSGAGPAAFVGTAGPRSTVTYPTSGPTRLGNLPAQTPRDDPAKSKSEPERSEGPPGTPVPRFPPRTNSGAGPGAFVGMVGCGGWVLVTPSLRSGSDVADRCRLLTLPFAVFCLHFGQPTSHILSSSSQCRRAGRCPIAQQDCVRAESGVWYACCFPL